MMTPNRDAHDPSHPETASVLLLSGFLGAGKTTLLKRILSWQRDLSNTVVLLNEFGDAGIDGALLEASGSGVVELTSGCICCTLSADLKQSLRDILDRFDPRRIFIESTGVADPTAIISALDDNLVGGKGEWTASKRGRRLCQQFLQPGVGFFLDQVLDHGVLVEIGLEAPPYQ